MMEGPAANNITQTSGSGCSQKGFEDCPPYEFEEMARFSEMETKGTIPHDYEVKQMGFPANLANQSSQPVRLANPDLGNQFLENPSLYRAQPYPSAQLEYQPYPQPQRVDYDLEIQQSYGVLHQPLQVSQAPVVYKLPTIENWMAWSICNFLCCCLILGAAAILVSHSAQVALIRGDVEEARSRSETAKVLNIFATLLGIVILAVALIVKFSFYN